MKPRAIIYIVILIFSCLTGLSLPEVSCAEINKKITEKQARHLLNEAYGNKTDNGPFEYNSGDDDKPFYDYVGISPPGTEGFFGYFAVNPWTGAVWRLWGCHRISTVRSRRSKAKIKRLFTDEEMKQYKKLDLIKPFCVVED